MKRIQLVASIASLLISTTGLAQNLFTIDSTPNICRWTGFYTGVNAGFVNHTLNMTDNRATSFLATIQQVSNPQFTAGLQIGYRYQTNSEHFSGVYGAELSVNFSDANFNKNYGSPFSLYQLNSEHRLNTVGLLEFIGGIAADRTLLFLAAGLSWVNISGHTTNQDSIAFFNSFSMSKTQFGTAIGGGIEYAYNKKYSVRLKIDLITPHTYSTSDNVGNTYQIANSIVQGTVGINYKFA